MAIELNQPALRHARALIREGKVVRNERDGWTEYSHWHLGIDKSENRETKGAYSFPFGDFRKVHRSGVIAGESRAGQYDHDEVRDALKALLELIDGES